MNENELRKHAVCSVCGKKIGHTGLPIFWTLRIERHGIKRDAVMRQDGLAAMLGGHAALANIMGPNEEMTMPMMEPVTVSLCETCSLATVCIAQIVERACEPEKD